MSSAEEFMSTFLREIIKCDPLKRRELLGEWAKKLEEREAKIRSEVKST